MFAPFSRTFTWITLLLSLLLMLLAIALVNGSGLFSLFNTDALFFQSFYRDLFMEGGSLRGWNVNTAFSLVPGLVLYFGVLAIKYDVALGVVLHGMAQYALFFWGVVWFYREHRWKHDVPAMLTGMLLVCLLFFDAISSGDFYLVSVLMHPYHFGAFAMMFFVAGFNFRWLNKPSAADATWIVVLGALLTFSNRMHLTVFAGPWIITLALFAWRGKLSSRLALQNMGLNAASVALGFLLYFVVGRLGIITFAQGRPYLFENILPAFATMFREYAALFSGSWAMQLLIGLALLITIATLAHAIRWLIYPPKNGNIFLFEDLWLMFSAGFFVTVFFAPAFTGLFTGYDAIRYNMFVLMLPLANLGVFAGRYLPHTRLRFRLTTLAFLLLFMVFAGAGLDRAMRERPQERLRQVLAYTPSKARCLDELSKSYRMKNGIGIYWDARPISLFSKKNIRVMQVHHDLSLYELGTTLAWYYPLKEGKPQPVFNFIVHNPDIDLSFLDQHFHGRVDTLKLQQCTIYLVPDFTFGEDRQVRERD